MRILMINSGVIGSTGSIMLDLASKAREAGYQCLTACPAGKSMRKEGLHNHIYIGNRFTRNLHLLLGKISGLHGIYSLLSTLLFLRRVNKFQPDIIHLHNLHDCYINLPMLFSFIKKHNVKVIWTLHDCWSFTGGCPHFVLNNCEKWKTGCGLCPAYKSYPSSYFDRSKTMWKLKKHWFTGVNNLTIVTPSQWLANIVKQSYLKDYPLMVINNGIDLDVFKPTPDIVQVISPGYKYLVLGVAFGWDYSKGLDVFNKLADMLPKEYEIVIIGSIEKGLTVHPRIVTVNRTENRSELARYYSKANVFVNPTRQEVQGLVNIEALACGTPVITFATGGSPECINNLCGVVVPVNDIKGMVKEIESICTTRIFNERDCRNRSLQYDKEKLFGEYINVYKHLYGYESV